MSYELAKKIIIENKMTALSLAEMLRIDGRTDDAKEFDALAHEADDILNELEHEWNK
jgi:hypothetical protein